jgi:hypothetical protein
VLERDVTPVLSCVESLYPDKKAGEPALKLFRIVASVAQGKKEKIKHDLLSLLEDQLKSLDPSYFKVFRLLYDLR